MTIILLLCLIAIAMNLPFGFYRAGVPKLSVRWFLAIHLPVPLIIFIRLESGQGWSLVPAMIACAVLGQLMGGVLRSGLRGVRTPERISVKEDEY